MNWLRWSRGVLVMVCGLELAIIAWFRAGDSRGADHVAGVGSGRAASSPASTAPGIVRRADRILRGIRTATVRLALDEAMTRGRDLSFVDSSMKRVCRQVGLDVLDDDPGEDGHCLIEVGAVGDWQDGETVAPCRVSLTVSEVVTARRGSKPDDTMRVVARIWQNDILRMSTREDSPRTLADMVADLQAKLLVDYVEANGRPSPRGTPHVGRPASD